MMIVMLFSSSGVVCPCPFIQSYFFGFLFRHKSILVVEAEQTVCSMKILGFFPLVSDCGTVDDRISYTCVVS